MDKDIDLRFLKIKSRMEINKTLEIGDEITFALKGSIVEQTVQDNQDGSVNITYTVKPTESKIE